MASEMLSIDPDIPVKEKMRNVAKLVRELLRGYAVFPASIFLGLPRESVVLRNVVLPLAVKENLRTSLGYEMEKYVPFTADDVYFDFQIIQEDKKENRIVVLLAIARKDTVKPYLELRDLLERGITGIGISCTATVNALLGLDQGLGDHSFSLIYVGKNSFEVNIVAARMMVYSRAYEIFSGPQGFPNEVIKRLEQSQKAVGLESGAAEVVLCGSDRKDKIAEKLKERGVPVRDIDPVIRSVPYQGLIPAFGLSLGGIKKVPNQLNLLPMELRKRPSKVPYYLLVFFLVLAMLGSAAWWGSGVFKRRLAYSNLQSEVEQLKSEAAKSEKIEKKCATVKKSLENLSSRIAFGTPVLDILKELTERIPEDAWLIEFSFSNGSVTLSGYSDNAAELIPLLEASSLFEGVGFLSTIRKTRDGKEKFRIGFKVR